MLEEVKIGGGTGVGAAHDGPERCLVVLLFEEQIVGVVKDYFLAVIRVVA